MFFVILTWVSTRSASWRAQKRIKKGVEKNKLNQLEERPIWVFRLLHTHPRCILWEFHACLLGFLELSSSKLLKKTPLPTSKRHQLMSVIGNVMELSILRSFFKPYKSHQIPAVFKTLPQSSPNDLIPKSNDLIPKSCGQPSCVPWSMQVNKEQVRFTNNWCSKNALEWCQNGNSVSKMV